MDNSEATEAAKPIFDIMLLVIGVTIAIGSFLIFLIIRSIVCPIQRIVLVTEKVGKGDLTEAVEVVTNDEVGQLGKSVNDMIDALCELLKNINDSSQ